MTKSLEEKWKKNDALMRAALKKMGLGFRRNTRTWEPEIFIGKTSMNFVECYGNDDDDLLFGELLDAPSTPEELGEIKLFCIIQPGKCEKNIHNVFYGIKNFAELQIKLDLMA